jgi:hypothetical protein
VIKPALLSIYRDIDYSYAKTVSATRPSYPYNSRTTPTMSKEEIRSYLRANPELLQA